MSCLAVPTWRVPPVFWLTGVPGAWGWGEHSEEAQSRCQGLEHTQGPCTPWINMLSLITSGPGQLLVHPTQCSMQANEAICSQHQPAQHILKSQQALRSHSGDRGRGQVGQSAGKQVWGQGQCALA